MSTVEKFFVNTLSKYAYRSVLSSLGGSLVLPDNPVLLELGSGVGTTAIMINDMSHPEKFFVTDYDASQVKLAQKNFEEKYGSLPTGIVLEQADALSLGYSDESFDAVFAFAVLHHLGKSHWSMTEVRKGLDEVARVLKVGGKFVYGEFFNKKAIREYLKQQGFRIAFRKRYLGLADIIIATKEKANPSDNSHDAVLGVEP